MDIQADAHLQRKSSATLTLKLERSVSLDLRAEAKRRGVEYVDLAAEIVDAVVNHKLYAAVLDQ